jgi:hypothetical protein
MGSCRLVIGFGEGVHLPAPTRSTTTVTLRSRSVTKRADAWPTGHSSYSSYIPGGGMGGPVGAGQGAKRGGPWGLASSCRTAA